MSQNTRLVHSYVWVHLGTHRMTEYVIHKCREIMNVLFL
uniref:Uncharacterized protein n=1 Tax=Anguilla anguilla TaxID=7936 RepID=A0A0E9SVQ2_ANGAN